MCYMYPAYPIHPHVAVQVQTELQIFSSLYTPIYTTEYAYSLSPAQYVTVQYSTIQYNIIHPLQLYSTPTTPQEGVLSLLSLVRTGTHSSHSPTVLSCPVLSSPKPEKEYDPLHLHRDPLTCSPQPINPHHSPRRICPSPGCLSCSPRCHSPSPGPTRTRPSESSMVGWSPSKRPRPACYSAIRCIILCQQTTSYFPPLVMTKGGSARSAGSAGLAQLSHRCWFHSMLPPRSN